MKTLRTWRKVFEADLEYIVTELKSVLQTPAVLLLTGPVGAGKTTFSKAFFKAPGRTVSSPSYAVIHEIGDGAHADFYRLKSPEELIHLELSLYLEEKNYFLIEWGQEYLAAIKKELTENHHIYELEIIVPTDSAENKIRHYLLRELD
jgi:tRNA threonylcarbamoyladenosine biosynthesis protein TsaE